MAKHSDLRSPSQQIAARIRRRINLGDLAPDAQLPTTPELIEEYGVAGTTIQKALLALKQEGLLVGRAGKGVFVSREPQRTITPATYLAPVQAGERYPWLTETGPRPHQRTIKLLEVTVAVPPSAVGHALGLVAEERAVLRRQLLLEDDAPVELADCYYPLDLATGTDLMEQHRIRGGTPRLLAELGYTPTDVVDEVTAEVPTPEEVELLQLPREVPILQTFRVVISGGRPIEATLMAKAGSRSRVRYTVPSAS